MGTDRGLQCSTPQALHSAQLDIPALTRGVDAELGALESDGLGGGGDVEYGERACVCVDADCLLLLFRKMHGVSNAEFVTAVQTVQFSTVQGSTSVVVLRGPRRRHPFPVVSHTRCHTRSSRQSSRRSKRSMAIKALRAAEHFDPRGVQFSKTSELRRMYNSSTGVETNVDYVVCTESGLLLLL